jgi:hypothetical protein
MPLPARLGSIFFGLGLAPGRAAAGIAVAEVEAHGDAEPHAQEVGVGVGVGVGVAVAVAVGVRVAVAAFGCHEVSRSMGGTTPTIPFHGIGSTCGWSSAWAFGLLRSSDTPP